MYCCMEWYAYTLMWFPNEISYYSQKIKLHFPEEMAANYQHVTNKHNMDIKFLITYHGHKSIP